LVENLRESINKLGGFSPEQVRQAASMGEDALQAAVLNVLLDAPKTGHDILLAIAEVSPAGKSAKAADLYPLLEKMTDLGLVKSEVKKDRKKFSLTELGKDAAAEASAAPASESETKSSGWATPNWVDLKGALPLASKRLAGVALEVAQHGSKEQQEKAAAAIDEARRKLHEILASD
jgi:DNA-binding PadR family transcriptional regulator